MDEGFLHLLDLGLKDEREEGGEVLGVIVGFRNRSVCVEGNEEALKGRSSEQRGER